MIGLNIFESTIIVDVEIYKDSHVVAKNHGRILCEGLMGECLSQLHLLVNRVADIKKNSDPHPHIVFRLRNADSTNPLFDPDKAALKSRLLMMNVSTKCNIEVLSAIDDYI